MEAESTAASAAPLEQELIEALLALSWPLPRTVEDADAALTRLEEVKTVLVRLEQQSVGTEAWWAGQVDGLATQSGFVLEWWRPVLREQDLDWTLNHQAHLTADLATLASAGARLLDQMGPRAAEEAEAAHARRAARDKRWGPAAVPPLHRGTPGPHPSAPSPRPQPPAEVFGNAAPAALAGQSAPSAPQVPHAQPQPQPATVVPPAVSAPPAQPIADAPPEAPALPTSPAQPDPATASAIPGQLVADALLAASALSAHPPTAVPPAPSASEAQPITDAPPAASTPSAVPIQPVTAVPPAASALPSPPTQPAAAVPDEDLNSPQLPPTPDPFDPDAPPSAAPPSVPPKNEPASVADKKSAPAATSAVAAAAAASFAPASEGSTPPARHRRPTYEFDDGHGSAAHPAGFPQGTPPPRSPIVPGPGFGGPPRQGRVLAPGGTYPPQEPGTGPFGFTGEDDDEPDSLVPAGLRGHQRRLLIQAGAILGAIGVLCWWAVYTLSSPSPHTSAAGDATHTAAKSTGRTVAAGGLGAPHSSSATATPTPGKPTDSASPTISSAPPTVATSGPDATTVSSVRVTLLGGSSAVPQIVALISVQTAGTGQVTVTGTYYGASGSARVAAETEAWTLSGKTSYQYSVPIANSAYCGTEFRFTAGAGGRSDAEETAPGC